MEATMNAVDDQETTQEEAQELLVNLCDQGFDGDAEQMALALGRPIDEIEDQIEGDEIIDDDLVMKVRGIALQRNLEIE